MANFTPNQNDYKNLTPFKTWLLLQINTWGQNNFPFVESDFDELTNYGMMQKLMKALNDVISNENMVEEDMTNLYNAFTELQTYLFEEFADYKSELNTSFVEYKEQVDGEIEQFETDITADFNELHDFVDNYFDNNFPQLVSNKLDEMAQDGTLENLLNDSAHLTKSYNTYTEMMADSSTFTSGLRLKTLGYYNINDGGGANYFVNNSVIATNYQIDLQNGLYLNLVNPSNVKQFGAKGDNLTDDTSAIQTYLNTTNDLYFNDGTYLVSDTLTFNGKKNIMFEKNAIIKASSNINTLFNFNDIENSDISQNCNIKNLHIDGNDNVNIGMVLSNYVNLYFENLQIDNCKVIGLKTKGTYSRQQAELRITKSCIRNYNHAYDDSIGIEIDSTDGTYSNMSVVDYETSFKINNGGNSFNDTHPWIHFYKLWNKSKAFVLPSDGGDLTIINGGFVDSIRTAYFCDRGMLNVSNMIIYYANTLYGDDTEPNYSIEFNDYIVDNPAQLFMGTNSTQLRISNIFSYIQGGTQNRITNIINSDNVISNCIFNPTNRWTDSIVDYSRNISKTITDSSNITSTFKYCSKFGRLVTLQYRGTLNNSVVGYTTLATLPYKPMTEVFFLDAQGKKMYITPNGELQSAENLESGYNVRFTITFMGNLTLN